MPYYKNVVMDIREAVGVEVAKGFETADEMKEVFGEIAAEYDVSLDTVWSIFFDMDVDLIGQ